MIDYDNFESWFVFYFRLFSLFLKAIEIEPVTNSFDWFRQVCPIRKDQSRNEIEFYGKIQIFKMRILQQKGQSTYSLMNLW